MRFYSMERLVEVLSRMTDKGRFIIRRSLLPTRINVIRKVGLTLYFLPSDDANNMSDVSIAEVSFNASQEDEGIAYIKACDLMICQILRMIASGEMKSKYGVQ